MTSPLRCPDPLDLEEIRTQVALHLPIPSLANCILVCKLWHLSFFPFLWRGIQLNLPRPNFRANVPPPDNVLLNSDHVRTLTLYNGVPFFYNPLTLYFSNLQTLYVLGANEAADPLHVTTTGVTDVLAELTPARTAPVEPLVLNVASTLTCLKITQAWHSQSSFWDGILPKLERLDVLEVQGYDARWRSSSVGWTLFAEMDIPGTFSAHIDQHPAKIASAARHNSTIKDGNGALRIRRLVMNDVDGLSILKQLLLIGRCPLLEDLRWSPRPRDTFQSSGEDDLKVAYGMFSQLAVSGQTWHRLHSLRINHNTTSEHALGLLVHGLSRAQVRSWNVQSDQFGSECFQAIRPHLRTRALKILDLKNSSSGLTSSMALEVLTYCVSLEKLHGDCVDATEVFKNRHIPWVCTGLHTLVLWFKFPVPVGYPGHEEAAEAGEASGRWYGLARGHEQQREEAEEQDASQNDLQLAVFEQLSRLKRLKSLDITPRLGRLQASLPLGAGLDLRLSQGLSLLGGLKQLQTLHFRDTRQAMEEAEVQWIAESFPKMEWLDGVLNWDYEKAFKLKKILLVRDIIV